MTTLFAVRFECLLGNGKIARSRLRCRTETTPVDVGFLTSVADAVQARYNVFWQGEMAADQAQIIRASQYEVVGGPPNQYFRDVPPVVTSTVAPAGGGVSGDSLPPQVSLVATLRTAEASRRGLGRLYFPPPPEARSTANGLVAESFSQSLRGALLLAVADIEALGTDTFVGVHSLTASDFFDLVTISVNRRVDTQRRRLQR